MVRTNFGVVEVVDRPQSQQVLSTRWVSKQKVRLVARGYEQTVSSGTDIHAGPPKLTTLRALLTIAAIHGNPFAFGDCQSAFHQSPMPSESEPVFVEPRTVGLFQCMALQESFSRTQDFSPSQVYSQHKENQRHGLQTADIRSFDVCEETCTILLRHMDDVVGTGPDEHLMSDFHHMKTSLCLTDVVVQRHEGDTVSFFGLEITNTSRGFEVENSADLVESLLNLCGL